MILPLFFSAILWLTTAVLKFLCFSVFMKVFVLVSFIVPCVMLVAKVTGVSSHVLCVNFFTVVGYFIRSYSNMVYKSVVTFALSNYKKDVCANNEFYCSFEYFMLVVMMLAVFYHLLAYSVTIHQNGEIQTKTGKIVQLFTPSNDFSTSSNMIMNMCSIMCHFYFYHGLTTFMLFQSYSATGIESVDFNTNNTSFQFFTPNTTYLGDVVNENAFVIILEVIVLISFYFYYKLLLYLNYNFKPVVDIYFDIAPSLQVTLLENGVRNIKSRVPEMLSANRRMKVVRPNLNKSLTVVVKVENSYRLSGQATIVDNPSYPGDSPHQYYMLTARHVIDNELTETNSFYLHGTKTKQILNITEKQFITLADDVVACGISNDEKSVLGVTSMKVGYLDLNKPVILESCMEELHQSYGSLELERKDTGLEFYGDYSSVPGDSGARLIQDNRVVAVHCGARVDLNLNYCRAISLLLPYLLPKGKIPESLVKDYFKDFRKIIAKESELVSNANLQNATPYERHQHAVMLGMADTTDPAYIRDYGGNFPNVRNISREIDAQGVPWKSKKLRNAEQEMHEEIYDLTVVQGFHKNDPRVKGVYERFEKKIFLIKQESEEDEVDRNGDLDLSKFGGRSFSQGMDSFPMYRKENPFDMKCTYSSKWNFMDVACASSFASCIKDPKTSVRVQETSVLLSRVFDKGYDVRLIADIQPTVLMDKVDKGSFLGFSQEIVKEKLAVSEERRRRKASVLAAVDKQFDSYELWLDANPNSDMTFDAFVQHSKVKYREAQSDPRQNRVPQPLNILPTPEEEIKRQRQENLLNESSSLVSPKPEMKKIQEEPLVEILNSLKNFKEEVRSEQRASRQVAHQLTYDLALLKGLPAYVNGLAGSVNTLRAGLPSLSVTQPPYVSTQNPIQSTVILESSVQAQSKVPLSTQLPPAQQQVQNQSVLVGTGQPTQAKRTRKGRAKRMKDEVQKLKSENAALLQTIQTSQSSQGT